ncbi:hypothetical protein FHV95_104299 [Streptomyces coelicolor]|nr:hypothetical protein FHV91_104299 [Streptomyces coelicolor]TYP16125.1 hypothetical protein FHV98_104145 [Streptomyces coelicolor A3(2)]TYP35872.1 hypothetical protein FHV94_104145 [Streptomyces coelicolor]TYP40787.1 hypothetical protein FHV92_104145 [Streptomyces coelicolor]TYP56491.1 hypothetical protein FHV95_104299 [Streptomyces coelicolor]
MRRPTRTPGEPLSQQRAGEVETAHRPGRPTAEAGPGRATGRPGPGGRDRCPAAARRPSRLRPWSRPAEPRARPRRPAPTGAERDAAVARCGTPPERPESLCRSNGPGRSRRRTGRDGRRGGRAGLQGGRARAAGAADRLRQGPLTGCGTPPVPAATLEPAGGATGPAPGAPHRPVLSGTPRWPRAAPPERPESPCRSNGERAGEAEHRVPVGAGWARTAGGAPPFCGTGVGGRVAAAGRGSGAARLSRAGRVVPSGPG